MPESLEVAYYEANKSSRKIAYSLPVPRVQSNHMTTMKTQNAPAKTTRKTNQEKALDAFCHHVASARELLTLIRHHMDDHMETRPYEVSWADVGSAAHVVEELNDVARFLNLINEEE